MSARLQLRRGVVVAEEPLTVEVDGERRPAWADVALLGEMREGDEVVVNVAAVELGLGSGGFDVVHVNLTRGLDAAPGRRRARDEAELHLAPAPGRAGRGQPVATVRGDLVRPMGGKVAASPSVLVLPLHGHLAPAAWALAQGRLARGEAEGRRGSATCRPAGGALPGSLSRDVVELRERGLLAGHVTAAPSYGGEHEAISVAGALDAAGRLGWDVAARRPGAGDHRLGLRARPRRDGGPGQRPRGPRAGPGDD